MNIEQAKAISIAEILARVEVAPQREDKADAYYISPFRKERTASLHVNKEENVWFDHGADIGGNAFELVIQILKHGGYGYSAEDGLRWLKNVHLQPGLLHPVNRVGSKKSKWKLLDTMPIENIALMRYLKNRGINTFLASKYVEEISVLKIGTLTKVYGLGFKNEDGGYELRNKFFKSCVSPKTISFIRADEPKPKGVMVFEGFMDFLTFVTIKKGVLEHDCVVLNSVACVDQAMGYIRNYGYRILYSWLDNDKAGDIAQRRLDEFVNSEPGLVHRPMNHLYKDDKDVNAWHMRNLNLSL